MIRGAARWSTTPPRGLTRLQAASIVKHFLILLGLGLSAILLGRSKGRGVVELVIHSMPGIARKDS